MKKMKGILIVLLAVMVTGCSNRDSKQQEANGIAIEQQTEKENQGIQSTDRAEEKETPAVTEHIVDYSEYFQGEEQFLTEEGPELSGTITEEEIIKKIGERSQYYMASAYYSEITDYWENVREVRDISNVTEPLFDTDKKYYTREEFEGEPMLVIHLAKNEIYARHGYIFKNEDLQNYFMGCIWYDPICGAADFDDSIFNEYEKANLEILADLDTY